MAYLQTYRPTSGTGGGGGGVTINGAAEETLTKTVAYAAGFTQTLVHTPILVAMMQVERNDLPLTAGTDYTLAGSVITYNVSNPYLLITDPPDIFTVQYLF